MHQLHKQIHKANYEEGSVINPRFELRTYKYSESIQYTPREKCLYLEFFWSLFSPAFGLNKGSYVVSLRIQSGWGKIRTRKTRNTDSFHALIVDKENALLASLNFFFNPFKPKIGFTSLESRGCISSDLSETASISYQVVSFHAIQFF